MKKIQLTLLAAMLLLASCGKQAQATVAPVATAIPATATLIPTETRIPATATPLPTDTPAPTQDPTVFGAIGMGEVQAGAIKSVASAIFNKTLDQFVADGSVQEYQIIASPSSPAATVNRRDHLQCQVHRPCLARRWRHPTCQWLDRQRLQSL